MAERGVRFGAGPADASPSLHRRPLLMTRAPTPETPTERSAPLGSQAESYLHRLAEVSCSRADFEERLQQLFDLGHEA